MCADDATLISDRLEIYTKVVHQVDWKAFNLDKEDL